jgi:hypothetical protein
LKSEEIVLRIELIFYFGNGFSAFLQGGVRFGREMVGGTAKAGLMREW